MYSLASLPSISLFPKLFSFSLKDEFGDIDSFEFPPLTNKTSIYNKLAAGVFISKHEAQKAQQVSHKELKKDILRDEKLV